MKSLLIDVACGQIEPTGKIIQKYLIDICIHDILDLIFS